MYILPISRNELLKYMPQQARVAEIGVASGEYSKCILDVTMPKVLHLIDPWKFQDREDYKVDDNNVDDDEQEGRFNNVKSKFVMEVLKGQVVIHRKYSVEAADAFEAKGLDWVYVDGMHTYDAVLADLNAFNSILVKSGFFLCDDFTNHSVARDMNFGVVEAIHEFTKSNDWHLIAMTNDMFPNCLLSRDPKNESTLTLLGKVLLNVPNVVKINDPWNYSHDQYNFDNNEFRLIPSF